MRNLIQLLLLLYIVFPQEKIFHSLEIVLELGLGGGAYGVQLKANHFWNQGDAIILKSGIGVSLFYGSENNFTKPNITTSGSTFDTHLRIYSGFHHYFTQKHTSFYNLEFYGGGYHIYSSGHVSYPEKNIESDYSSNELFEDYGVRIGFGYQRENKAKGIFTITNSWRQIQSELNPWIRFLSMEPDAKSSVGLSMSKNY